MKRRTLLLMAAGMPALPLAVHAQAQMRPAPPPEVREALPDVRLVGAGEFRFFGLSVYEARLWAPPGPLDPDYLRQPLALELRYARTLKGESIAERSVEEMRRAGPLDEGRASEWLALMRRAFPDVSAGERLTGLSEPSGRVRFLHNGRPTAETQDAEFARRFFGIWLAPSTSAPALRRQLLGPELRT
jgi:hypothetical protein